MQNSTEYLSGRPLGSLHSVQTFYLQHLEIKRTSNPCTLFGAFLNFELSFPIKGPQKQCRMELIYSSKLPRSRVQAAAWSGMNIIALSISTHAKGVVSEHFKLYVKSM